MPPKSAKPLDQKIRAAFFIVEKESKKSSKRGGARPNTGGKRPGAGRPKGSLDKGGKLIREMVAEALDRVGGVDYLSRQAAEKPVAFMALLGKVLPVQVTGDNGGPIQQGITVSFVSASH